MYSHQISKHYINLVCFLFNNYVLIKVFSLLGVTVHIFIGILFTMLQKLINYSFFHIHFRYNFLNYRACETLFFLFCSNELINNYWFSQEKLCSSTTIRKSTKQKISILNALIFCFVFIFIHNLILSTFFVHIFLPSELETSSKIIFFLSPITTIICS